MPFSRFFRRPLVPAIGVALFLLPGAALFALPSITQQPQSASGNAGSPVSLGVAATGNGPLAYQWRRDGIAVANATSAILTLPRPSQADSGFYDVIISDGLGTATTTAAALRIGPTVYPDLVTPQSGAIARLETIRAGFYAFTRVRALADGRYYVTGDFSSFSGQPRTDIARFKADGTVDDTFVCTALDGTVYDMALQADGRIVVAGNFRTIATPSSFRVARLNTDGSLDRSFAVGETFANTSDTSIRVGVSDNAIFVSGTYSVSSGSSNYIVKLDLSGIPDSSFTPPRFDQQPGVIAATDGKIYCLGSPYEQAGVKNNNRVCRLLGTGAIDPTFNAGPAATSGGPTNLFRQQDGRLLLLGQFTNFGGATNQGIVRLNENGTVDRSFNLGLTATSNYVSSAAQAANGDLYVCGVFSSTVIPGSLARIKLDGSVDRTFAPTGALGAESVSVTGADRVVAVVSPFNANLGRNLPEIALLASSGARLNTDVVARFPAAVTFMRLLSDGKFLVAGTFTHWNGTAVPPIVRVNADLTLDASFRAAVNSNHAISGAVVQPDGKIVVVGPVTSSASDSQLRRLNADGTADASFRTSVGSTLVSNPTILADGRIVVPDYFTQPIGLRVVASDGTTLTDHEFNKGGTVYPATTYVTRLLNGQFLVAGGFTTWAGQAKPKLVRLNADGSVDASLTIENSMLYAIGFDSANNAVQSTGRIILPGQGIGASVYTPGLRGLLPNGQADPAFVPALPTLYSLSHTIQADDRLLVWGRDTSSPPTPRDPFVLRLLPNGTRDSSFAIVGEATVANRATLSWSRALILDNGDIVAGTTQGNLMRFARVTTPVITEQPLAQTRPPGQRVTLTAAAAGPGTLSYQWYFNGAPIFGATSASLTLPFVLAVNAGQYHATVTNANGSTATTAAALAIDSTTSADARLTNLSVRATIGASPLITGFSVAGGTRDLLVRGIGPGLAPFGVSGTISDPRVVLYSGTTVIEQNDDWGGTPALTTATIGVGAFALPAASLDAVLLRSLVGSYTAQLSGAAGGGAGLTEIYDATTGGSGNGRLSNLSARYQVGSGADVLIAGFTIGGSGNKALLVRGIGPGLAAFGVPGTLVDPQIAIYSGIARIAENNDWGGDTSLISAAAAVGAFALAPNSKDAALLITLPPGSYTVQLSGVGGGTGEGLIEIYEIP